MVTFAPNEMGVTDDMWNYNHTEQTIKEKHVAHKSRSVLGIMYSLEGVESHHRLPFWFIEEWLTPIGEGVEA